MHPHACLTSPTTPPNSGAISENELEKQLREIEKAAQQQAAQDAALFGGSAAAAPRPPPPPPRPGGQLKPPMRRDGQYGYKEVRPSGEFDSVDWSEMPD